jgi:hypothetical protein
MLPRVKRWLTPALALVVASMPAALGTIDTLQQSDAFWNLIYPAFVLSAPFLAGLLGHDPSWRSSGITGVATALGFFPSYIALVWFHGLAGAPLSASDRRNVFALVILIPPGVLLFIAISRLGAGIATRHANRRRRREVL